MKKFILGALLLLFVGFFYSCDNTEVMPTEPQTVAVTIDLNQLLGQKANVTKDSNKWVNSKGEEIPYPLCSEDTPTHLIVVIDGKEYTLQFTELEGQTEVLQLNAEANNIISSLIVYSGESAIYEMPHKGSKEDTEAGMTSVPYDLELHGFEKAKIQIDVVCWHEFSHQTLTWQWYAVNYHQIKTLCFFGDICTKFYEDFHEKPSPYAGQDYQGYDFAAIFDVNIYADGELMSSVSNLEWQGNGKPLCVQYMDNLAIDEDFTLEIILYMPDGSKEIVYTAEFEDGIFSEEGNVNGFGGEDGVFTFAVGNCDSQGNNDVDLVLPSYLPLPETATFKVTGGVYANGESYLDLWLKDITGTYAIANSGATPMYGFCGDKDNHIQRGKWYPAKVYSSLDEASLPTEYSGYNWGALNWIANHKDGYTAKQVQVAIWAITNAKADNALSTAAKTHSDYKPKVGEYAIVLFDAIEMECEKDVQLFIVRIDP